MTGEPKNFGEVLHRAREERAQAASRLEVTAGQIADALIAIQYTLYRILDELEAKK